MRESTLEALWNKAEPFLFIEKEQFFDELSGWLSIEHLVDGEVAFVTLQKGPEFHFQTIGKAQMISRKRIREFLAPIIAQYGYAQTRTPKDDMRQDRFNRKLGFTVVAENEFDRIYRIKRLPKCQS